MPKHTSHSTRHCRTRQGLYPPPPGRPWPPLPASAASSSPRAAECPQSTQAPPAQGARAPAAAGVIQAVHVKHCAIDDRLRKHHQLYVGKLLRPKQGALRRVARPCITCWPLVPAAVAACCCCAAPVGAGGVSGTWGWPSCCCVPSFSAVARQSRCRPVTSLAARRGGCRARCALDCKQRPALDVPAAGLRRQATEGGGRRAVTGMLRIRRRRGPDEMGDPPIDSIALPEGVGKAGRGLGERAFPCSCSGDLRGDSDCEQR